MTSKSTSTICPLFNTCKTVELGELLEYTGAALDTARFVAGCFAGSLAGGAPTGGATGGAAAGIVPAMISTDLVVTPKTLRLAGFCGAGGSAATSATGSAGLKTF